jgi:hypothetical protein
MAKRELCDVTMQLHHETPGAVLVSDDGDRDNAKWLPRSQIEIEEKGDGVVVITLPVWLAKQEGLI